MAERYFEIRLEKLMNLHDGLEMLELLDPEAMRDFDLHLFGITQDSTVLDAAREAIAENAEEETDESDVTITEVAVAIPIFADMLYRLDGSGVKLKNEDFAYQGQQGEGIRTLNFAFAHYHPTLALNKLTAMALSSSNSWLDDFYKQYGNKQPVEIKQQVRRNEEATQPGVPTAPAAPQAQTPVAPANPGVAPAPGTRQTSSLKIRDVLETLLGE